MQKTSQNRIPTEPSKPKRKLKYKFVKSIVGQYIKGRIRASDIFSKQKRLVEACSTVPAKSIVFQACNANSSNEKRAKFVHRNIEVCAPDILCLNFSSPGGRGEPANCSGMPELNDKKSVMMMELKELKRISASNETQIGKLLPKLNQLKLSISLLSEEQQRLEHSREIRTIGLKLLNNMLKGKYNAADDKTQSGKREQYEREKQIIEKILEQLARLEKVKMKLEYENIRSLYTIKELKKENTELEKIRADSLKELNFVAF